MTEAEKRLWRELRAFLGSEGHFRRQATIGPYFVDFACHEKRIAIEVDGGHHNFGRQAERDIARDKFLKSCGYRVLRFWNNDVIDNLEGVLIVIQECVRCGVSTKPPTPNPSPPQAGGGGLP